MPLRSPEGYRPLFPVFRTRSVNEAQITTFVSAAQLSELRSGLRLGGDLRVLRPATRLIEVDPSEARRWANRQGLDGAFPVLMFVGPLEYPSKVAGVVDLVTAFREVRRVYSEARLLIIGDGSLRKRVEEAAASLGDSVTVTGFVDNPRVALARADLYCHISRQEGLAMALGLCVIGSRIGGIPEVLDASNGALVGSEPKEIGSTICDLLVDAERRKRLAEAARMTIQRWYTWDAR